MSGISRRQFFETTAGSAAMMALVATQVARLKANPLGLPIGTQTYPFRARIQAGEFAALCKDLKAAGIETVELCNPAYAEFKNLADGKATKKILDDNGLRAVSAHCTMPSLRNDQANQIKWAHDVGLEMMSTADLGATAKDGHVRLTNGVTTEDEVKQAADEYNAIGANAKKEGIQQILHDETYALSRLDDGRLTYPVLIHYLDPDLVKMQFQMSAMYTVGDPIAYFMNYPGRFVSVHLQAVDAAQGVKAATVQTLPDKNHPPAGRGGGGGGARGARPGGAPAAGAAAGAAAAGAAPARGGRAYAQAGAPVPDAGAAAPAAGGRAGGRGGPAQALGEDSADWPRIFAAAKTGGLKYPFIELNDWDAMVRSVAYLKTLS